MRNTNTVVAIKPGPAPRLVLTQGAEKRGLTIPELAQYLGMTNWAAEEALREGKIRFKWMGKRKVVDRRDADTYFDSLPYAQAEIKEPKPREPKVGAEHKSYMSDRELRVRGLRVHRTNGLQTHRNRIRTAKVLGFKKDSNGKICVRYTPENGVVVQPVRTSETFWPDSTIRVCRVCAEKYYGFDQQILLGSQE